MDTFTLSRNFCNFAFENPEKINPWHYAIYFFAIEHCNRLWWKEKFWFPSQMVMEATGIKNWRTYQKYLQDLIDFWFIKMIETSKNQYSSNIIAIVKNTKALDKALDKALQKHSTKHSQSTDSINIQYNNIQETNKQVNNKKILSDTINIISEAWSGFSMYLEYILNSNLDITDEIDIEKARLLHSKIIEYKQILNWNEEKIFIEWKNMVDWYVDEKRQVKNIKRIITNWFSKKLK